MVDKTMDPHTRDLRDAMRAEHARNLAEVQAKIDDAPNDWWRRFHQEHLDRLKAVPTPWEDWD